MSEGNYIFGYHNWGVLGWEPGSSDCIASVEALSLNTSITKKKKKKKWEVLL
jgi:hypothetical protein